MRYRSCAARQSEELLTEASFETRVSFESDISDHVPAIQDLFAKVLETQCGPGELPVGTICDRIGIHRKLAWQIRNVAYSKDPFRAVRFMPTRGGIETLVAALQKRDVSEDMINKLRETAESFVRLTDAHAGDRTNLDMLVQSFASTSHETETKWREKAFLGNSFIWGVQAKTQFSVSILNHCESRPGWIDIAQVRGLVGLRRVRPNVHWLVNQSVVLDDRDAVQEQLRRTPLDAEAAKAMGGVPVVPAFCSSPLPRLRRRTAERGMINDELLPGPVGARGQQDIVTGEVFREVGPAHATHPDKRAHFGAVSRTPSEVFLMDHFVHRDLFPMVKRELCVFGELNSPVTMEDDDLLPVSETIESRGRGLGAARTPEVPRYLEMLRWIFDRLEWEAGDFDLYRVRLPYPPVPSSVMIRHPFPNKE